MFSSVVYQQLHYTIHYVITYTIYNSPDILFISPQLLTKSGQCERKVFLNSYLNHDIFGLRKPQSNVVDLISKESSERSIEEHSSFQQSVVRLMNAMASVKSGRDYLGMFKIYWGFLCTFHSLQRSKEIFKIFAKASKENLINEIHIIILYFIVVNKSCNTYS